MISGPRMFMHLSEILEGRVHAMFIYVIDKNVESIKSVTFILIISRYSNFLQDVNIYAWLNFSKKKYKAKDKDLFG